MDQWLPATEAGHSSGANCITYVLLPLSTLPAVSRVV